MTGPGTRRLHRPDPRCAWASERWGRAEARADLVAGALLVTLRGEVDATNGANLADYVERHASLAPSLLLDTRAVDFFGTAGVAALRRIDFRLGRSEVDWSLVAGAAVRKTLRVCRADDLPQTAASSRSFAPTEPGHDGRLPLLT